MTLHTDHHYAVRTTSTPGYPGTRTGMSDPGWTPALSYREAMRYLTGLGVTPATAAIVLERAHLNSDRDALAVLPDDATGLDVWASDRGTPGTLWRVSYLNHLDGRRHVLLGALTEDQARRVHAVYSNRRDPSTYLPETAVETDDGTADGAVIGG